MEAVLVSETKGYARFVSEQPPYNLLDRRIENELVPMCQAYGLGIWQKSETCHRPNWPCCGSKTSRVSLPPSSVHAH